MFEENEEVFLKFLHWRREVTKGDEVGGAFRVFKDLLCHLMSPPMYFGTQVGMRPAALSASPL